MPLDSQDDPRVGNELAGRYRVLERLAGGAMGVVYRGERIGLGRVVAIKFLHASFAQSPDFLSRFEHEARAMSRLDHPNCVSVIDFGVADTPFFVMDFVSGTTCTEIIEEGPVEPRRAIGLVRQVLAGLAHAHERGIVHRDVKPANIMVAAATGAGEQVRILDFGLAKLVGVDVTLPSFVVGTPSYMSPEQASGAPVDARSDLYATVVVLFELLTGKKPFSADEPMKVMLKHVGAPPPSLAETLPGAAFSPELERVVRRGLAKDPNERYQTPAALSAALAAVPEARGARVEASKDLGAATTQAAPRPRPPRGGGVALGLVVAAVIAAGAYAAWTQLGQPGLPAGMGGADAAPSRPPSLAEADRLAKRGERDEAIRVLHELRRQEPGRAEVLRRLGALYFDKGWPAEGVAAYREALDREPRLASDPRLLRDLVAALGAPDVADKAHALLVHRVGPPALSQLRAVARGDERAEVRRRAKQIQDEIEASSR